MPHLARRRADTGAPEFGGAPLPGGAKLVRIDLANGRVLRVYPFAADVATPKSYVDDVRFHGRQAYLTDAGKPGLTLFNGGKEHTAWPVRLFTLPLR